MQKALAPFTYTRTSPSNDLFGRFIDALDVWYYLWAPHKAIIRDVIVKIADVTIMLIPLIHLRSTVKLTT
jgi:hypothetical protein